MKRLADHLVSVKSVATDVVVGGGGGGGGGGSARLIQAVIAASDGGEDSSSILSLSGIEVGKSSSTADMRKAYRAFRRQLYLRSRWPESGNRPAACCHHCPYNR